MSRLTKRLYRIDQALNPKGIKPEEVRFLLGQWHDHGAFPEDTRPYAREYMTRYVQALEAMDASVPTEPPNESEVADVDAEKGSE